MTDKLDQLGQTLDKLAETIELRIQEADYQRKAEELEKRCSFLTGEEEVSDLGEALMLKNVSCTDSTGQVFEHYEALAIKKKPEEYDMIRDTYNSARYFEQQGEGWFLPSLALICNILVKLFKYKEQVPDADKILRDYFVSNTFAQNTVINNEKKEIINYPRHEDLQFFRMDDGSKVPLERPEINVNHNRTVLGFAGGLSNFKLSQVRKGKRWEFLQQLTGLPYPTKLVEIADHYGVSAECYFSHPPNVFPMLDFIDKEGNLKIYGSYSVVDAYLGGNNYNKIFMLESYSGGNGNWNYRRAVKSL